MNESDLDLRGRIAYLLGKSDSFTMEEDPNHKGSWIPIHTKWKTEYLVSQIIDAVVKRMLEFPTSPEGLGITHVYSATDSMISWLKGE